MARGRFLTSLQEIVTVTGERGGLKEVIKEAQPAIVMEDTRIRIGDDQYTTQRGLYIVNICPPCFKICVNDLVTRHPDDANNPRGSSSGQLQVLVIQEIRIVYGKQQLQCRDIDTIR